MLFRSIDFIEGNYGFFGNVMYPISSVALSQTGRIPDGARELRFSGFQVAPLINGELPTRLPSGWYDITEYSGEEVELIWHFPNFGPGGDNRAGLDSIAFVVPKPSTSALLTLGAAGLLWALRPRRKTGEERS